MVTIERRNKSKVIFSSGFQMEENTHFPRGQIRAREVHKMGKTQPLPFSLNIQIKAEVGPCSLLNGKEHLLYTVGREERHIYGVEDVNLKVLAESLRKLVVAWGLFAKSGQYFPYDERTVCKDVTLKQTARSHT